MDTAASVEMLGAGAFAAAVSSGEGVDVGTAGEDGTACRLSLVAEDVGGVGAGSAAEAVPAIPEPATKEAASKTMPKYFTTGRRD
jgi:hypothetical protein